MALGALVLTACGSKTTVVSEGAGREGISVQGQGVVYGAPDVADIDIGVQAQARTVAEAREQAASTMDAVVKSITGNGVAKEDIRTVQFSVDPRYSTPPGGGTQQLIGYQVSNVVTVRIRKIDTAGKVVDDATAAGGNNTIIRRIQFSILDPSKLQADARALAVKDAKERADKLAQLSGVKLGKPIVVSESLGGSGPIPLAAPATGTARAEFATTIESGQLKVTVNVSISYEIAE
jgi:uncharacterized protein YggE